MANGVRANVTAIRSDIPTIHTRKINRGARTNYQQTRQEEDQIMLLEAFPEIDVQEIEPYEQPELMRMGHIMAYVEGFAQSFSSNFLYGNSGDIGEIDGVLTKNSTLNAEGSGADLRFGNVWNAGGSGADLSSVLMIDWGLRSFYLIYPKGAKMAGLSNKDLGKNKAYDSSGNPYLAYSNNMKMEYGFSNPDRRCFQRLANIETAGTTNNLIDNDVTTKLIAMKNRTPTMGQNGRLKMYCNRHVKTQFDTWALNKENGFYMQKNISGGPLTMFQGIPVKVDENILSTEDAIS